MPNFKRIADTIKDEVKKGLPDGLSSDVMKEIPHLFNRIDELERALQPFARVYSIERTVPNGPEMVHVRKEDCKKAMDILDPNQAYTVRQVRTPNEPEFYYPA